MHRCNEITLPYCLPYKKMVRADIPERCRDQKQLHISALTVAKTRSSLKGLSGAVAFQMSLEAGSARHMPLSCGTVWNTATA